MQLLPKWVLTNPRPGVYDTESGTAADMTAKVYGAMNSLIEEYNAFADSINSRIEEFTGQTEEQYNLFALGLRQEFQDFIDVITIKYEQQDQIISNAFADIERLVSESLDEIVAAGSIKVTDETARSELNTVRNELNTVRSDMDTHTGSENNPHQVTAQQVGALPGVPHGTYTNDYYRVIGEELEWVNPPMVLGVEYRTTERHNGLPVYTKLVDCGVITNGTTIEIDTSIAVIRFSARATNKVAYPFHNPGSDYYREAMVSSGGITFVCGSKALATDHVYCQIWYTK